jgi:alkylated DNA nucleotide flippase Atl1
MRACSHGDVPCQRVVRSDGMVAGHSNDVEKRIAMLKREGIQVKERSIDLSKYFFDDFRIIPSSHSRRRVS